MHHNYYNDTKNKFYKDYTMTIYISLLISVVFLNFVFFPDKYGNGYKRAVYCIIIGLFFTILPAFRGLNVGLDTYGNMEIFREASKPLTKVLHEMRHEPIYLILALVCNRIDSLVLFQTICAVLYIYGVAKLIKNYSATCWLSFLFFFIYGFYYFAFNEMRQASAIGICCLAIKPLLEGKWIRYILIIIIGSLFHYSALMMLPLVIIKYIPKLRLYHLFIAGALFGAMMIVSDYILIGMNDMLVLEYGEDDTAGGYGLLALQVVTVLLGYIINKKVSLKGVDLFSYYMIVVSIIVFPFCHLNTFFFRQEQYSWIFMIIIVPNLLKYIKGPLIKYPIMILYIAVGFYQGFTNCYTVDNKIFPYQFFWE